jgi:hypothetical protein
LEFFTWETAAILFFVATAAGFVDSIAGGGGLIALPALLWTGMSPAQALGTTKLQGTFGTFSSSFNYLKKGQADLSQMKEAIFCTFLGSALGAVLVQISHARFLADLIPVLLVMTALFFIFSPRAGEVEARMRISHRAFALSIGTGLGFYDGFFGPGSGSFFALAYVWFLGLNLTQATAHSKILNLVSNLSALALFIVGGAVVWGLGMVMACGQFLGARLGSNLVVSHGARLIRPLIIVVSLAITAKMVMSDPSGLWYRLLIGS